MSRTSQYFQVLDAFRRQQNSLWQMDRQIVLELLDMAYGGDGMLSSAPKVLGESLRSEYYPGWTNEHFQNLLVDLGYNLDRLLASLVD